ncbi:MULTISPECIES: hypothetical protein [Enterococcus]|jgi:hypothetical protein|uniref:hypothetical protein n=1 Tax=Enterococcus TaxID=1350 RepID=UPI00076AF908|nr:hypothetical protein [Enterococcus innesii]AMG48986.1 hypothetical protein AL523_04035 [Enterococcus gallinarum]
MMMSRKFLVEARQFIGTFIILSLLWSISSLLSTQFLVIDPVVIIFGLQGYFVYIIARDKVNIVKRVIICLVTTYLGVKLFDVLGINQVTVSIPLYLFLLAISIVAYLYLKSNSK